MALAVNSNNGFLTTVIRPAGMYGEGDMVVVVSIIENAKRGSREFQIGNNTNL